MSVNTMSTYPSSSGRLAFMQLAKRGTALLLSASLAFLMLLVIWPLAPLRQSPAVKTALIRLEADVAAYRGHPLDFQQLDTLFRAVPAYEDREFFARPRLLPPLSLRGLARALVRNLQGIPEGGSTIPQQLAKLYLRGDQQGTLHGKLRELLFATHLSRSLSQEELIGLYLNLSADRFLNGKHDPARGLERLSLALLGRLPSQLQREDQLILGGTARGLGWLRAHPLLSWRRVMAARAWMVRRGWWDAGQPSYLDDLTPEQTAETFRFLASWREMLATHAARSSDLDLAAAMEAFRRGLRNDVERRFPGTALRFGLAVIGQDGRPLARSGFETAVMRLNYGSIAKLEPLVLAVEAFGPEFVRSLRITPQSCIRWGWSRGPGRVLPLTQYCPTDVAAPTKLLSPDEGVARSINTTTVRFVSMLPYLLLRWRPDLFQQLETRVRAKRWQETDLDADRAIAVGYLEDVGISRAAPDVPLSWAYTPVETALFEWLLERRVDAGLPRGRMPQDPTQSLGNSSSATLEQIGLYVQRRLVAEGGGCKLSNTGALLALHRREGTLSGLASRRPTLIFAGKTGTSSVNDAAVAAVCLCLDGRPVTLVAGARPLKGELPRGFHGSIMVSALHAYLQHLEALERRVTGLELPAWAQPTPEGLPPEFQSEVPPKNDVNPGE